MGKTDLLSPSTAVQITWACTGTFSKDKDLRLSTFLLDKAMTDMKSLLKDKEKDLKKRIDEGEKGTEIENEKKQIEDEKKYLTRAMIAMNSCLRSLHTMYKGRELNFEENTKLRNAYLDSLKENIDFGNRLRDILKSLPTMILGAAGSISVSQTSIGEFIRQSLSNLGLSPEALAAKEAAEGAAKEAAEGAVVDWAFLAILAALGLAIGYIFNDLLVRWSRKRKQMLYIINDYERNIYYDRYIEQVETSLESLYRKLNQIHNEVFSGPYDEGESRKKEKNNEEKERDKNSMIEELIGAKPKRCDYFNRHMREKKITPGQWTICETGWKDDSKRCPHWRYEESINIKNGKKSEMCKKNEMSGLEMDWYRFRTFIGRFWYLRLDY